MTSTHKCIPENWVSCLCFFTMVEAAKGSVELLSLSAKTQEKDFYSIYTIWVLKHNIHTLYKVSGLIFRCNNLVEAHNKRYTIQRSNPGMLQGTMSRVKAKKNYSCALYHHSWAHSSRIWLWVISSDSNFINTDLLKTDTHTLWSTCYWLLLVVLSIFKYFYPCERLWCLMSGPTFNSPLNWGSEKSDNELV